jgi:hypothetical protein
MYLYEMALQITYTLKGYDAEGNCIAQSQPVNTTVADSLKALYATSSGDALMRTLITDTLIVGDESAKSMTANYQDSDLAKTNILEGFDISDATQSVTEWNTIDENNEEDANFGEATTCTHRVRRGVSVGKVPYITYFIKDTKGAIDRTKLEFVVSYTQVAGDGTTSQYNKTFNSENTVWSGTAAMIGFDFSDVSIQDGNADITCKIYYDGELKTTNIYSVETYLDSMRNDQTIGKLCVAMMKLGASFRAKAAA